MKPEEWLALSGLPGVICPVCERVVESLMTWGGAQVGYAGMKGTRCCARCAASLTSQQSQRCGGWLVDDLRKIVRPSARCRLHAQSWTCVQCARSPAWAMTNVARSSRREGMACPRCLAAKRMTLPLKFISSAPGLEVLHCSRCRDCYVCSEQSREFAAGLQRLRSLLHTNQRAAVAQWQEWLKGTGACPQFIQSGKCSLPDSSSLPEEEQFRGWEGYRCALLRRGPKGLSPLVLRLRD
jgi:hypothetical protein